MIVFKSVKWKNLLSTGNNWTEIEFNKVPTTLIIGHNGSGKSTMLDALSFGLFGKPHRKINIPQLINTINNKHLMVEVEFDIGSKEYKIIRGMKPNVFEIWVDGVMINQNSKSREYQQILEKNIIKLNHKSFHQIVVLGSSSFVPFMQLKPHTRREVIEDLLDINMFSKMNWILRERVSALKTKISDNKHSIDIINTKADSLNRYIRDLSEVKNNQRKELESSISKNNAKIDQLDSDVNGLVSHIESQEDPLLHEKRELAQSVRQLDKDIASFNHEAKHFVKQVKFFKQHSNCPTCQQEINQDLKTSKVDTITSQAMKLKPKIVQAKEERLDANQRLSSIECDLDELNHKKVELNGLKSERNQIQRTVDNDSKKLEDLKTVDNKLSETRDELVALKNDLESRTRLKAELNDQMGYYNVTAELLKDTGIKTKIIKQYIPVINKLTNQYLQILDFFVHFDLDENFSETIRSRHRDAFSYDSFSEGEKQRIDLSLLFTWRQIAKMKNSVATNLLVLDETFDSSLDEDGVDNLMKILNTLDDGSNVFVISHKPELDGQFSRTIQFVKDKNFSKIIKKNIDL